MLDKEKTKEELLIELQELRNKVSRYEEIIQGTNNYSQEIHHFNYINELIERIPIPIFYKDTTLIYRGFNDAYQKFFGIDKEYFIGKTSFEVYQVELATVYDEMDKKLLEEKTNQVYEYEVEDKEGVKHRVILQKSSILNKDGSISGILGVINDLTKQYEIEKELKLSQQKYKLLVDNAFDAIYLLKDKHYEYVNPRFCEITGYSIKELTAPDFNTSILLPTQANELLGNQIQNSNESQKLTNQYTQRIYHKTGKPIDVEISNVAIGEQGNLLILGIMRDISERKQIHEELINAERRYRMIFNHAPLGFIQYDKNERIIDCNYYFQDLLDIERENIIGSFMANFFNSKLVQKKISNALIGIDGLYEGEYQIPNNNRTLKVILYLRPLLSDNLSIVGGFAILEDITVKYLAEESIRKSEEKYRTIFDISPEIICIIDDNGIFVDVNKQIQTSLGYKPEDIIGKKFEGLPIFSLKSKTSAIASYIKRQSGQEIPPYELEFLDINNNKKYGRIVGNTFKNELNKTYLLLLVSDVTNWKTFEIALKKSEEKFRGIIEHSTDGISLFDENGYIIEWNNSMEILTGIKREAAIGKYSLDIILSCMSQNVNNPDFLKLYSNQIKNINTLDFKKPTNQLLEFELRDNNSNQSRIVQQVSFSIETKTGHLTCCFLRDVTKLKVFENSLKESEEKFRSIVEQSTDGIIIVDNTYKVIEWNKAMELLTGYSAKQVISMNYFDLLALLIPPPLVSVISKDMFVSIMNNKSKYEYSNWSNQIFEINIKCKDGTIKTIQEVSFPIIIDNQILFGSIKRDVTYKKRLEEELINSKNQLEERVNNRTYQLELAMNELEAEILIRKETEKKLINSRDEISNAFIKEKELNELKSRFISMISHEYRTPLTIIQTTTYLIEKLFQLRDEIEFNNKLEMIRIAVQNMVQLLEDVLVYGRIESGELAICYDKIDIIGLTNDIISEITIIDKNQHVIKLNTKEDSIYINSSRDLIKRILSNLLINSTKFAEIGSRVDVVIKSDNSNVLISVVDKGIGIPKDDLRRIFEPFFRATNIGTISGIGLGLPIVKGCLDNLHGRIDIDSIINEGTRVYITIPKQNK